MEKEIKISLDKDCHKVEVIKRNYPDILDPKKISITGQIDSALRFIENRISESYFNIKDSVLIISKDELKITLNINNTDPHKAGKIEGNLQLSKDFKVFEINTGYEFEAKELGELIKMNRSFFENTSVAMELASKLKNIEISVDKHISEMNDNKGNISVKREQAIRQCNIPDSFVLIVPIFKGFGKEPIGVECYINPNSFKVMLVSPDANEIIQKATDSIIDAQETLIIESCPELLIIRQ